MDTEKLMNSIPELPEDFEAWVRNIPLRNSKYLFKFTENGKRKGYCTHCEKIVSLDHTDYRTFTDEDRMNLYNKHNERGHCPSCRTNVTFKDNYRGKGKIYDFAKAIILQRINNIACFRFFDLVRNYENCNCSPVNTQIMEEIRLFLDISENKAEMWKRNVSYADKYTARYYGCSICEVVNYSDWYKMNRVNVNLTRYWDSSFYNIEELNTLFGDTDFKYCDLDAYENNSSYQYRNYIKYITTFCKYPKVVEFLMKAGYAKLFCEYLSYPTHHIFNMRAKTTEKLFKLSKAHIKYFKNCDKKCDCDNLSYLQELEKAGYKEDVLRFLYEKSSSWELESYWKTILKYTTIKKTVNYLEKQHRVTELPARWYADYIKDCEKLGYDLAESAVLFPRDLFEAHTRTIELIRAQEEALRTAKAKQQKIDSAKKTAEINNDIKKRFKELNKKYEFHSNGLFIRPAMSVKEIKNEGETQHICVGSDTQNYIKNHAAGIAFILFVRKESEPDKPFYTVEITKSDYVAQCRGAHNQGKTEEVQAFMIAFQKYLKSQTEQKSA
ncbi:MAG: PcfJ domain-containing protein [Clostridia bacterium]|nr:PcfJ domain-containing protein [Clostridia bacterium]